VAPLALHLLGIDIPSDLEARVPEEVLEPKWLAAHKPQVGAPTELPVAYFEEGSLSREGEGQVLDRLRALGYVE
jgi:hypothetical protein